VITVKSYKFDEVIEDTVIDYLSIDVEGGELDIVKTIDFNKYFVKVMSIENNYEDEEMISLIESYGFEHICDMECDNIFKNSKFN